MSYAVAENPTFEGEEYRSRFAQIGFFALLFIGLMLISGTTSAYSQSCTGVANLTGPLLPTAV